MKTIYLIRHGETQANREDLFRGRNEIPLSESGLLQAEALREYFRERPVERIFSSPLNRALQTAAVVFPGRRIESDERINNLDLGEWSGRAKKEIEADQPELWDQWVRAPERMKFPGGETLETAYGRVEDFLRHAVALPEQQLAVLSHRSMLKVMLAVAFGLRERYFWKFHLDNASVSILLHEEKRGFTLFKANYTEHLSDFVFEWN